MKIKQNKCQKCQSNIEPWPEFKLCPDCWLKNGKSHELKNIEKKKKKTPTKHYEPN